LKLEFVAFDSRIDFHTQIYSSTHFYMNISKHKSLLVGITFNQNPFYRINSIKINPPLPNAEPNTCLRLMYSHGWIWTKNQ